MATARRPSKSRRNPGWKARDHFSAMSRMGRRVSSFGTNETGVQFGGSTADKGCGYFSSRAGSLSDRLLDPINFENLHNSGNSEGFFSSFDFQATARDALTLNLALGRSGTTLFNLRRAASGLEAS